MERYCDKTDPGDMMDKDTVYVLAYAIIIPNTNQHNPNMKPARMGMTDLAHNLRWRKRFLTCLERNFDQDRDCA